MAWKVRASMLSGAQAPSVRADHGRACAIILGATMMHSKYPSARLVAHPVMGRDSCRGMGRGVGTGQQA